MSRPIALVMGAGDGQARSAWTHELDLRPWVEPW